MGKNVDEATTADDRVGTTLADRYLIDSVVGRGGMSVVYRATDSYLGRTVAVKIFRPDLADAEDLRRQREEIQLLASLNHSTLVTLYDAVADPTGRVSVILEYIEGRDLRDELLAGGVDAHRAASIGADVADALAYIHERGIVHRDLKPANLLVPTRSPGHTGPQAKLTDFGIARLVDGTRLTGTGSVLGTAGYLSPEQAIGRAVGPASDVYSLGLVLLECLTGVRAFEGSAIESVAARLSRDPDVPAVLGDEWVGILSGMTCREPADRPDARAVTVALRALAASGASTRAEPDPTRPYDAVVETAATEGIAAGGIADSIAGVAPTAATAAMAVPASTVSYRTDHPEHTDRPDHSDNAATSVLPRGSSDAPPTATARRPSRRTVIVAAIAVLIVGAVAWIAIALASAESAAPTIDYPIVEGDLGSHLEQLQDSVE